MRYRNILLFGSGLFITLVIFIAISFNRPHKFSGSVIDPPAPAPEFTLSDTKGQQFHLADQVGKTVLMFFGYTSCPDVCPVTLADFKAIKTQLGDRAENVRFVFITVDPERDSPDRINKYLTNFDEDIVGLTGTRAALETVWSAYGVFQDKVDTGSSAGYLVDHSSRIYIIDPAGNLRVTYLFGTNRQAITEDLLYFLNEKS
jgi:protein SCO1/2